MNAVKRPVVVIQARMSSSRFPGKSMALLNGTPIIGWLFDGARAIAGVAEVAVAVPHLPEDDVICKYAESVGVRSVRGPVDDVLERYCIAAETLNADPVIRLCADSPLLASDFMGAMLKEHLATNADLTHGNAAYPLGSVGEVLSASALAALRDKAKAVYCREHVSPYIHEHPEAFRINRMVPPVWMQRNFRLTVDTPQDMEMMHTLFSAMTGAGLAPSFTNAMAILDARPEIASINASVTQRDWRAQSSAFSGGTPSV